MRNIYNLNTKLNLQWHLYILAYNMYHWLAAINIVLGIESKKFSKEINSGKAKKLRLP